MLVHSVNIQNSLDWVRQKLSARKTSCFPHPLQEKQAFCPSSAACQAHQLETGLNVLGGLDLSWCCNMGYRCLKCWLKLLYQKICSDWVILKMCICVFERHRNEQVEGNLPLFVPSPTASISQGYAKLKPRTWNSVWVYHLTDRDPST